MLPIKDIRLQLGELLGADATYLAPIAGNKIALVIAAFVPEENLVIGDLTLAAFTGSTPKVLGAGTQNVGIDPTTGEQVITMKDPAGGLIWECSAAPVTPEVVYGIAMIDDAEAVLLGTELLSTPITITDVSDQVLVGSVQMRLTSEPLQ